VTEVLDLRMLPDEGLSFDEPLEPAWLDGQLADMGTGAAAFHADKPGAARIDVSPLQPVAMRPPIRIAGRIEASVATTCVRCLQPLTQTLAAEIDLTLFARGREPARADEDEEGLSEEELDEGSYDGNELDLPAILREALLLEIAMNPSCDDEAKCSERTSALLEEANREASQATDDRWAALRRLIPGPGSGEGNTN
jgi:uncharacterized protein